MQGGQLLALIETRLLNAVRFASGRGCHLRTASSSGRRLGRCGARLAGVIWGGGELKVSSVPDTEQDSGPDTLSPASRRISVAGAFDVLV